MDKWMGNMTGKSLNWKVLQLEISKSTVTYYLKLFIKLTLDVIKYLYLVFTVNVNTVSCFDINDLFQFSPVRCGTQ